MEAEAKERRLKTEEAREARRRLQAEETRLLEVEKEKNMRLLEMEKEAKMYEREEAVKQRIGCLSWRTLGLRLIHLMASGEKE